jgi:uncharacterized protein YndB with AHSA1/START domain
MSFDKTIFLPLDTRTVFDLVTQPERLRRWSAVAARVDLRIGGEFRWTVAPSNSAIGTFTKIETGKSLHFTWGWEGNAELPPGASTVSITLDSVDGGTNLRFVHADLTADQEREHAEGWNHYLNRLVEFANKGTIGADPWSAEPGSLDELTCAEAALAVIDRVLFSVTDQDLLKVASYKGYTVAQIIDHLCDLLGRIKGPTLLPVPKKAKQTPEMRIADLSQPVLEMFRVKGVEAPIDFGRQVLPARVIANLLTLEYLVRACDIAKVTDQKIVISPILIDYISNNSENLTSHFPDFAAKESLNRLSEFTGRPLLPQ